MIGPDDPVLDSRPREDVGAQTLARFRFQSEVAARAAFATLDGSIRAVVCEWHEDHLVVHRDGTCELVSVKHRELSQGPWTIRLLVTEGGLAHLFERWSDTGKRCRCHLATNGGLRKGEPQDLAAACAARDETELRRLAAKLWRDLGAKDETEAVAFLMSLTIEAGLPGRRDITAANLHSYVRPALKAAGFNDAVAEAVYELVVQAIEVASRDRIGSTHILLGYIADPDRLREDVARHRVVDSRTITAEHVRLAVANADAAGRRLLAPRTVGRSSNLVRKLERGGIGPTHVESAQRLRAAWSEFEALYRSDLPGGDDLIEDLRSRVQARAAEAEDQALTNHDDPESYGIAMYEAVKRCVRADAVGGPRTLPVDDLLLEGLVYQLTDECPVWWSPRFDLSMT